MKHFYTQKINKQKFEQTMARVCNFIDDGVKIPETDIETMMTFCRSKYIKSPKPRPKNDLAWLSRATGKNHLYFALESIFCDGSWIYATDGHRVHGIVAGCQDCSIPEMAPGTSLPPKGPITHRPGPEIAKMFPVGQIPVNTITATDAIIHVGKEAHSKYLIDAPGTEFHGKTVWFNRRFIKEILNYTWDHPTIKMHNLRSPFQFNWKDRLGLLMPTLYIGE